MTLIKLCTVNCDGFAPGRIAPDCVGWIGNGETGAEARSKAKVNGWRREDGRDICPRCQTRPAGWLVTSMTTGETWEEPLGEPVSPEDFMRGCRPKPLS